MPLPVLIALFLAFGFDTAGDPSAEALSRSEIGLRVAQAFGGVAVVGAFGIVFGRLIAWLVVRHGGASYRVRRSLSLGARLVDLLSLVVYGRIIFDVGWADLIHRTLGEVVLLDEVLIFLPFLLAQVLGWWGLHAGERAVRFTVDDRPGRHVWLKARQAFGMVLPVAMVYAIGSDLARWRWPDLGSTPWEKPLSLALMGAFVLVLSPCLVRIAWPTRPLPPGPLRDRLERLTKRVGFRCTDILVWETNGTIINAGVTGSLPWFRYVLLTDALIESLDPPQIAAVFGHEIGHIAHRHLVSFALFMLGSLGVYALADSAITILLIRMPRPSWLNVEGHASLVLEVAAALLAVGGYFLIIFGHLSRRFERQADVFGCRVVSCDRPDCPPHLDLDDEPGDDPSRQAATLCPNGIWIFVSALQRVAFLNGMKPKAWSWRHGSIQRRIAFLESLTNRPEAELKFQRGVSRMRKGVAAMLALTLFVAFWNGLFR